MSVTVLSRVSWISLLYEQNYHSLHYDFCSLISEAGMAKVTQGVDGSLSRPHQTDYTYGVLGLARLTLLWDENYCYRSSRKAVAALLLEMGKQ